MFNHNHSSISLSFWDIQIRSSRTKRKPKWWGDSENSSRMGHNYSEREGSGVEFLWKYFPIMCTKWICVICSCVCLYLCLCVYVCLLITWEWDGRLPQIFKIAPGWPGTVLGTEGSHASLQADWALGTRQAIGVHTGEGRQCTDAI